MKFKVRLEPEAEGRYSASVPALPGCYSHGDTLGEALDNIREAAALWLEVAEESATVDRPATAALHEIEL